MIFGLELTVLHTTPPMLGKFSVACLKVMWRFEQKNMLYRLIVGQPHFSIQRRAKMSLASNEPHKVDCSSFTSEYYLQACTTRGKCKLVLYVEQPMGNQRTPTPVKQSHSVRRRISLK